MANRKAYYDAYHEARKHDADYVTPRRKRALAHYYKKRERMAADPVYAEQERLRQRCWMRRHRAKNKG